MSTHFIGFESSLHSYMPLYRHTENNINHEGDKCEIIRSPGSSTAYAAITVKPNIQNNNFLDVAFGVW